jgi:hypothetical protein
VGSSHAKPFVAVQYDSGHAALQHEGMSMSRNNVDLSGLWLSPFVIASRLPTLFTEALNPDPTKRVETNRMVAEKVSALQDGILGAQLAFGRAFIENATALAFGKVPASSANDTASSMMNAGLAPAARMVKANAKRLRKK